MADVSLLFNILTRDQTGAGLNSASGKFSKFQAAVKVGALASAGALAALAKSSISVASDTAEATSKVQNLLGESSKSAIDFANTSATAYGMSKREALDSIGAMSAVQVAMGVQRAEAGRLAAEYTKLSADLGSFNNASSAEVQQALTASLSGEYEMLKKYGIIVNEVTLAAEAQRIGMVKRGAAFTTAQKRQLSYNIIMASTKAAQGDFARTSDGLANQTKILSARMEDLQGKIGAKLLPVAVKAADAFNSLLSWMERNQTTVKLFAAGAGVLAGAIVTVTVATKVWAAATATAAAVTKAWAVAQRLLTAALILSPIGVITLAVVGLIAVIVLIATKTDWFQRIWSAAWGKVKGVVAGTFGWIRSNWPKLLPILTGPFGPALLLIVRNFDKIKAGAQALKNGIVTIFNSLKSAVVGVVQSIRNAWNSTLGGRGISIPEIDIGFTKIGGGGFSIPYLAKGGVIGGAGAAVVGERGPELVHLAKGAQVTPLTGRNAPALGGGEREIRIVFDVTGSNEDMKRMIRKMVRAEGGNVQIAFGQSGR